MQAAGRAYEALEYDRAKHTVRITHLNLESLYSVRRFSQDILATLSVDTVGNATNEAQSGESLDCLLLCAGVVNGSGPPAEGDPKHCLAYTVNYLCKAVLRPIYAVSSQLQLVGRIGAERRFRPETSTTLPCTSILGEDQQRQDTRSRRLVPALQADPRPR